MSVTIADIAKKAGVSRGTVDRALHNRAGVNPKVAADIKKLAEEMGFTFNRAGRILAAKKHPIKIICIFPSGGNEFYEDVRAGYEAAAAEYADFNVQVVYKEVRAYHDEEHIAAVKSVMKEDFQALCLSTVDHPEIRKCVNELTERGVTVVTVNNDLTETNRLFFIGCNYYKAGQTAAGVFSSLNCGKLRFILVSGTRNMKNHNQRIVGFTDTLKSYEREYSIAEQIEVSEKEEEAYLAAKKSLQDNPDVNCIYMVSAGVSGICKAIEALGKERELFVLCYDDVPTVRHFINKGIIDYTLCQEPWLQGYKAIQQLFDYFINNKQKAPDDYLTKVLIKKKENLD